MIKKSLIFILTLFLLCGCTAKTQREEIVFSSWGSVSEVNIIKTLISDFEQKNPDIKVNFMHIPQNYFQKIQLLFASNTEPDVIFINNLYLPIYASRLENLSSIVNKDEFYPQTIEGMSIGGKLHAVPRDISNQVFYVNTDMIDLPNKNWSIEDLLRLAVKSTKKDVFGISCEDTVYWAYPYLSYFGGGILDKNGELIINSEKSIKGIEFYKDLKNKYKVAPSKSQIGSSTLAQMFIEEKLAMYFSGRWMFPKISEAAKFNWAVITFPKGENPSPCDVSGWAIAKNSKHKASAYKFVTYLSNKESSEYFAKTGLIVPARKDTSQILNTNRHNEKAFLDAISDSETRVVNKDYKKLTDKINLEIDF